MASIIKLLRSITPGSRPSGQTYGVPYFNFGDKQFGGFDSSNVAQDLIGVPFFSNATSYSAGQPTNFQGQQYVAKTAIAAGTFNPAQWIPVSPNANWQFGGFVNKFRNPKFESWQRGSSITAPNGGGVITADGWYVSSTGSAFPVTYTTAPPTGIGAYLAMLLQGVAGNTSLSVYQFMESLAVAILSGQNATVSIAIYNGTGATFTPSVNIAYANATDNWSSATIFVNGALFQPCPVGTWTRIGYTFNAPTQVKQGIYISFVLPPIANPSYFIDVVQADVRATPGLPVGICYNPPPFEDRSYTTDQNFVKRYYQIGSGVNIWSGSFVAGSNAYHSEKFYSPMRIPPTINMIDIANSGFPAGAAAINQVTAYGIQVYKTAPAPGFGWYGWSYNASAEF